MSAIAEKIFDEDRPRWLHHRGTHPNLETYPKIEMSHLAEKIFKDHASSILGDLSLSQLIRETAGTSVGRVIGFRKASTLSK